MNVSVGAASVAGNRAAHPALDPLRLTMASLIGGFLLIPLHEFGHVLFDWLTGHPAAMSYARDYLLSGEKTPFWGLLGGPMLPLVVSTVCVILVYRGFRLALTYPLAILGTLDRLLLYVAGITPSDERQLAQVIAWPENAFKYIFLSCELLLLALIVVSFIKYKTGIGRSLLTLATPLACFIGMGAFGVFVVDRFVFPEQHKKEFGEVRPHRRLSAHVLPVAFGQRGRQAESNRDLAPAYEPFFTPPASPTKAPNADGYIQRWLLLDPIQVQVRSNQQLTDSFVQTNIKKEYFPNQLSVIPRDGDKVKVGDAELTWHAVDATGYNVNLFHFASDRKKPAFNAVYWAVTIINCPRDMRDVRLSVGSNSASIWWVNGREVIDLYGDRHMLVDDGVSKRLTLKKGDNIVRAAVINSPGLSNMCARFLDGEDRPVKGFTVSVVQAGQ